jgi:ATP-dependent Clp protease adapter protein ClpS
MDVVSLLEDQLGMNRKSAIRTMLQIHEKGGALLPLASLSEAEEIARSTTSWLQAPQSKEDLNFK